MARIVDHLSIEALEARYRAARDATEARHTQAIWLLAQGRTFLEVAEVLAFAPRWVEELAARTNAQGPEALGDQRRRNGRAASLLREDVLAALADRRRAGQVLVGFAAETGEGAVAYGRGKLERKRLDAVVVNDVAQPGIGFDATDNEVTIVTATEDVTVPRAAKDSVARVILDTVLSLRSSTPLRVQR